MLWPVAKSCSILRMSASAARFRLRTECTSPTTGWPAFWPPKALKGGVQTWLDAGYPMHAGAA